MKILHPLLPWKYVELAEASMEAVEAPVEAMAGNRAKVLATSSGNTLVLAGTRGSPRGFTREYAGTEAGTNVTAGTHEP